MRAPARLLPALLLFACVAAPAAPAAAADAPPSAQARRVVSMNPSLTSILVALGAAGVLVGIEEYSAQLHPALAGLPRVGGLFNPSLEAVVALEPDLVVLVPSVQQRDFVRRLSELGIDSLSLPNLSVAEILDSIEVLGARVGRAEAARERVRAIHETFERVRGATSELPAPRTLVALQREPLFVVGRGSFVEEMLAAAGATNVAGGFREPYPRVAVEWVISAAPDVLLDVSDDPPDAPAYWSRWPSIPAVENGRVVSLAGEDLTYPGPYLDRALRLLARTLHGDALVLPAPPDATGPDAAPPEPP